MKKRKSLGQKDKRGQTPRKSDAKESGAAPWPDEGDGHGERSDKEAIGRPVQLGTERRAPRPAAREAREEPDRPG